MPRSRRREFSGAIHLITLNGCDGGHVFYDPGTLIQSPHNPRIHAQAAQYFERLLWETTEQYGAVVHAYFLEPNAALMVVQTHGAPLGWIMHDLLARYSRYLIAQCRLKNGGRRFPKRYKAQLVQSAKLPYAVRYVERRKNAIHPRRRAINHPFSSSLIHCGRRPKPENFVVADMRQKLRALGYSGANAYLEFICANDTPIIAQMLSRPVIGGNAFRKAVRELYCNAETPHFGHVLAEGAPSPDEILRQVTETLLHVDSNIAYGSTHRGALARSLVAWYAMRTGVARIGTVAQWFGITSPALRSLIRRHRLTHPHIFSIPTAELFPSLLKKAARFEDSQPAAPTLGGLPCL
jgi:hypothetical protein